MALKDWKRTSLNTWKHKRKVENIAIAVFETKENKKYIYRVRVIDDLGWTSERDKLDMDFYNRNQALAFIIGYMKKNEEEEKQEEEKQEEEKQVEGVLQYFLEELHDAPASEKHHLNTKGGLLKHLDNTLKVAKEFFPNDKELQFLAATHDIGKARTYGWEGDKVIFKEPNTDHILNTIIMLCEYNVQLLPDQINALQFHHGGWSGFKGMPNELGAKLHFCDLVATIREEKGEKNESK
jgi:hypothetical protein